MEILSNSKPEEHWFLKYKLYHIPFWLVYHYLWWVIALGSPAKAASSLFYLPFTIKFSFYVVFQALAVYFNLYFLVPRYLEKSRFSVYVAWLLATIAITSALIVSGYYISSHVTGVSLAELYGGGSEADCFYRFLGNALPSTVASMTLAMSIKLTRNWIRTERKQQLMEKEKLETELKFLKNQFNPHFLFNTINSIFFLIHKNPDMASDALAKFSELLRYQLFECNDLHIPLDNEISYIENFIGLEKLRQNGNMEVFVDMERGGEIPLEIAPFILMIFVENAFKHVSKHADKLNRIQIELHAKGTELRFKVINTVGDQALESAIYYGGIGLKNVQRRLDLIYPGEYQLDIVREAETFEVNLKLTLSKLSASAPSSNIPAEIFNYH